jgi:hypothetical protein
MAENVFDTVPGERSTARDQHTVVRLSGLEATTTPPRWRRIVPAWAASAMLHAGILSLFLLFQLPPGWIGPTAAPQAVIQAAVDERKSTENLENVDIGLDPELPTQFNVSRIEDVSVPGAARPEDAVGILNAPDALPTTIPPPPGLGGTGQGGFPRSDIPGTGSPIGLPGGMGGPLIPGGFGGRSGATREQLLREGGGNRESEAAVARGLQWFARHQAPDGHWSLDQFNSHGHCNCDGRGHTNNDVAATALGLLPLLGAGQTHRPSADHGRLYTKNVERALKYLMSKQTAKGDFGGGMYGHGLAAIAVCEAYGLTGDPALARTAQRAVNFIVAAQNDKGGWRYQAGSPDSDTSVVGWQVMALKSAQLAGLDVPAKAFTGASRWLDSCASPDGGTYGYTSTRDGSPAMMAVGLLCRQYMGWGPRNPGLQAGVNRLKKMPPTAGTTIYYTYYATQVMHHMGGEAWQLWNAPTRDVLIAGQDKGSAKAHQLGSWDPQGDTHGGAGGRIMVSSLSLLTLEVYYRHLPLYRRDQVAGVR